MKKTIALLLILMMVLALAACGGGKEPEPTETLAPAEAPAPTETLAPAETPAPTETLTPTETLAPTEEPIFFVIMGGEIGEYGEEVVLNAGTEFEEHEIAYHIPAGTYMVTNLNANGGGQVSVYSGGPEYDGEWQYFVADENCASPIVVMAGDTQELVIKEGQFIVLSDGTENIQFVLK